MHVGELYSYEALKGESPFHGLHVGTNTVVPISRVPERHRFGDAAVSADGSSYSKSASADAIMSAQN